MSTVVMLLVAVAAAMHVLWNTLVKRCYDKPAFALLTSVVGVLAISPIFLLVRFYGTSPIINGRWQRVIHEWQANRRDILIVGVCAPMAYFLIIIALKFGNVTLVTAGRNIGILFSAIVGGWFLKEHISRLRVAGAVFIACGVIGLVLFGHIP